MFSICCQIGLCIFKCGLKFSQNILMYNLIARIYPEAQAGHEYSLESFTTCISQLLDHSTVQYCLIGHPSAKHYKLNFHVLYN